MGAARQRKLDARARRQESMATRYNPTAEKTIIQVPQPKALQKNEVVKVNKIEKVKKVIEKIPEKRGRGRPPKSVNLKNQKGTKKVTSGAKEKKNHVK